MSADRSPIPRSRALAAHALPSVDGAARSPRRAPRAPSDVARRDFVALSVVLTGFDDAELWGTGMVDPYLGWLLSVVGDRHTGALLTTARRILDDCGDDVEAVERLVAIDILADATLGPLARNLVVLWYLGQWNQLPAEWRDTWGANAMDQSCIISPEAYVQGLAWPAIGTHPPGAKMPGYGSWALPPAGAEELP